MTYNQTLVTIISLVALTFSLALVGAVLPDKEFPDLSDRDEQVDTALAVGSISSTLTVGAVYIWFLIISSQGGQVDNFYYAMHGVTGRLLYVLSDAYKLLQPRANEDDIIGFILPTLLLLVIGSIGSCVITMICDSGLLSILNNVFRIALLFIQACFFGIFTPKCKNRVRFNVKDWWNYVFGFLVASQMCSWLVSSFAPLMYQLVEEIGVNRTVTFSKCDKNALRFFDSLFKYFYVEFATVSVGVLLIVWNRVMFANVDGHCIPVQANVECAIENPWIRHGVWTVALMIGLCSSAAIVATCTIRLPILIPYFIINNMQLGRHFILVISAFYMLVKLSSFTDIGYIPLSLSEHLVIFTSLFDIIWLVCRQILYFIYGTTSAVAIFIVLWVTIAIVNTITQTYMIIALRRKVTSLVYKYLLVFFICWNFAVWIETNFIVGSSTVFNSISPWVNTPGVYTYRIITILLFPLSNLYRFQFTLVAFELYRKKHLFYQ